MTTDGETIDQVLSSGAADKTYGPSNESGRMEKRLLVMA